MGVNTARIDTYAFALGSGYWLAVAALSQVGNVGRPGQAGIVDAFMRGGVMASAAGWHRVCGAGVWAS
jgi:urea transport system permease protein